MTHYAPITTDSDGELILQLDDELCKEMGWKVGDDLLWEQLDNGSWSLRKNENSSTE